MIAKSSLARLAVGLVTVAAVVVYPVTDNQALATACLMGLGVGAVVGAWIGAERTPRGQRSVPRLIAAGLSLALTGQLLLGVLESIGADTDVSIADPPWLASYLFFGAAMWVVLRQSRNWGAGRVDVDFLIDALTIVVVAVLIIGSVSISAVAADDSVPPFTRIVWAAYPLASAVVFALAVRVMTSRNARAAIGSSFAVGAGLVLVANLIYLQAPEGGAALVIMDAAWMLGPVLAARSAWRVGHLQPDAPDSPALGGWALAVAIGPLFVPPALVLITNVRGEPSQPLPFFIGTAVVTALAFVRTARLIRSEERARRELVAARDAALEASMVKSMFLARMSHEIRTPLTTMLAAGEILEDLAAEEILENTPRSKLQSQLLEKIHRSGDRLQTLVEGILDFSAMGGCPEFRGTSVAVR